LIDNNDKYLTAFGEVRHRHDNNIVYSPSADIDQVSGEKWKIGLGHRRLSIIDISTAGHMPMCLQDQKLWITYNGEIFNYIEIRNELIESGCQFYTKTDTEVILQAYRYWGAECLHKLNGMWAFIIVDISNGNVFCARDRYGIKPMYYTQDTNDILYFGSEIKQFETTPAWTATINQARCLDYLLYAATDHSHETMFDRVFQILPGHYIQFNSNLIPEKIHQVQWYSAPFNDNNDSFEVCKHQFGRLFDQAIRLRLRSDVEVGSALSGGMDSGCIVSKVSRILADENKNHLQKTFTAIHDDERFNEERWARIVIDRFNIDAAFIKPSIDDIISSMDNVLYHQDEPFQSQSTMYAFFVFQEAAAKGVKVLLNGQGADEYLGGYGQFRYVYLIDLLRKLKFRKWAATIQLYMNEGDTVKQIARSLLYFVAPKSWIRKISIGNIASVQALLNPDFWEINDSHPNDVIGFQPVSIREQISYYIHKLPLQKYLRWEDRNSMAHSIEARVPFLDHELVEFTSNCNPEFLSYGNNKKILLKESQRNIAPDDIIERKDKIGFKTAEEMWVRDTFPDIFRNLMQQAVSDSGGLINEQANAYMESVINGTVPFDYTYWRIILFGRWVKLFNLKTSR